MKAIAFFRTPEPIRELGSLLLDNKLLYCSTHGYTLIHDDSIVTDSHYSWGTGKSILSILKNTELDFDWLLVTGTEYLFTDIGRSAESIIAESQISEDQDIFVVGEFLHSTNGVPNLWFSLEENKDIDIIKTVDPKLLMCTSAMFVKRTDSNIKLISSIINDTRFASGTVFDRMLPEHIDRFQLAMSIYYDAYVSLRSKFMIGPVKDFACLPKGDGTEYDKLRKIMRKIVSHDYSEFKEKQYTTTIWCLSTGVDIAAVSKIIADNLENVK